jgi:hypothetical protein
MKLTNKHGAGLGLPASVPSDKNNGAPQFPVIELAPGASIDIQDDHWAAIKAHPAVVGFLKAGMLSNDSQAHQDAPHAANLPGAPVPHEAVAVDADAGKKRKS